MMPKSARKHQIYTTSQQQKPTVASLQELHLTTSCDDLPSRLIVAVHTLQLIDATPVEPDGMYGGGKSVFVASD